MILFVVTEAFRRHFRPRRPDDDVPIRPLIALLLYWFGSAFGGLCGSIGLIALIASTLGEVRFESAEIAIIAAMTALAPVFLWIAYVSWRSVVASR